MPRTSHLAVLETHELRPIMTTARATSPLAFALTAWCYEFGARTAEPGLQKLDDLDMRLKRARPAHLKAGKPPAWHMLMPFCREALPLWLEARPSVVSDLAVSPMKQKLLFPTLRRSGHCETCAGSGHRPVLKRDGKRRYSDSKVPCHHCAASGRNWGIARTEVYKIVSDVLRRSGVDRSCRHPHVLRHSVITHLLDAGVQDTTVQDRVGHKALTTTLEYKRITERALQEVESKMSKVYGGGDE